MQGKDGGMAVWETPKSKYLLKVKLHVIYEISISTYLYISKLFFQEISKSLRVLEIFENKTCISEKISKIFIIFT